MAPGKNGENAPGGYDFGVMSWINEKVKGPNANKPNCQDKNNPWMKRVLYAPGLERNSSKAAGSDANGKNAPGGYDFGVMSWIKDKVQGPNANKPNWSDKNNPWMKRVWYAPGFDPNSSKATDNDATSSKATVTDATSSKATVSDATGSQATNKGTAIGDKGKQQMNLPFPIQGATTGLKYKPAP